MVKTCHGCGLRMVYWEQTISDVEKFNELCGYEKKGWISISRPVESYIFDDEFIVRYKKIIYEII